jgi:VanZ family protein
MIDTEQQNQQRAPAPWWVIAAPFAVMAIIFALSSRSQLPDLDGGRDLQNVVGHLAAYTALGASLTLLFRAMGWGILRSLFFAVVISTLYGVSDEFHQSFVPNRNVDPKDVLVDFLGAMGGSLAMLRLIDWRNANALSDAAPDQPADGNS